MSVGIRKIWGMGASTREEIIEVFNALDTDLDRLCELSFDVFTTPERLRALERLERVARRLRAPQHALTNQLDAQACEEELGGTLRVALADRLRITKAEAARRIADAVPPEWYEFDTDGLHRLVEALGRRRSIIRDLITQFRTSTRNPFPLWTSP